MTDAITPLLLSTSPRRVVIALLLPLLLMFPTLVIGHQPLSTVLLDELFSRHTSMMMLIDPSTGAIVDANQSAIAYYGYPREQLLQMKIQQINTLSGSETEQEFRLAAREQRSYFLFRHRQADGSVRPVEVYSSPVTVNNRSLLMSIIHDVSERETLEESIVQSEARFRLAERVAGIGHWTLDLAADRYNFSAGGQELLGLDQPTADRRDIRDRILPEYRSLMTETLQQMIRGNTSYDVTVRYQRPDGRILDLNSQGIYDADADKVFGVIHDITEAQDAARKLSTRTAFFHGTSVVAVIILLGIVLLLYYAFTRSKKAETALRASKVQLQEHFEMTQLLLDSTAEGIYGTDLQGNCIFCNRASLRILGYQQPEELIGGNIHDLIHHSRINGTPLSHRECELLQHMDQEIHCDNDVFWRADGSSFPVEYWSYPIRRDDRPIGSVVTFFDISDRKAAAAALARKSREMESFVYSISHDLKSPLVTVHSFLNLLKKDLAAGNIQQASKDIEFIEKAADKMEQLLGALLQLSRVGRMNRPPEDVPVLKLIEQAVSSLAGPLRDHRIAITITEVSHQLHGDTLRLGQIWQNLIENAVKYMGDQPNPRIDIGWEGAPEAPIYYVRDNGIGIAPEHAERVFAVFSQLNNDSPGVGLGLAMVKKIVELYQGKVWLTSTGEGNGSCFYFTLPGACKQ